LESNASRWEFTAIKKIWKYHIAIDGPAHGLSSGKNLAFQNMQNSYCCRKIQTSVFNRPFTWWKTCLYYQSVYQSDALKKMVILGSPSDFKII
jgi:cytidylate kinase